MVFELAVLAPIRLTAIGARQKVHEVDGWMGSTGWASENAFRCPGSAKRDPEIQTRAGTRIRHGFSCQPPEINTISEIVERCPIAGSRRFSDVWRSMRVLA
jgi:hypothetical protein